MLLYPNGSSSTPGKIAPGDKFTINNPYPGYYTGGYVEICVNGLWGQTHIYNGIGCTVTQINSSQLLIAAGSDGLATFDINDGSIFTYEMMESHGKIVNPKPFRVFIYKISKM